MAFTGHYGAAQTRTGHLQTQHTEKETSQSASKRRIKSSTKIGLVLFGLTLATYGLEYLANLVLARNLSPERYGDLVVAFRILGIAASLALLGTATSAKRFLAQYLKHHDTYNAGGFVRWNMRFVQWPFVSCILISVALTLALTYVHLSGVKHIEGYHLAIVMVSLAPILAMVLLIGSYLQCNEHNLAAYLPINIIRNLFFLSIWWVLLAMVDVQPSNLLLVFVVLLVSLSILTMQLFYVKNRDPALIEAWRERNTQIENAKMLSWQKNILSPNDDFCCFSCNIVT